MDDTTEYVKDYPRPPRVERVDLRLAVWFADRCIAETSRGLRVLETYHPPVYYFPEEDVDMGCLRPESGVSFCEWKGMATWWSVQADGRLALRAAWAYPNPRSGLEAIKGCIAFYAGKMDRCTVGEHEVRPQPGGFYGGWITPGIRGPYKGEKGTGGW